MYMWNVCTAVLSRLKPNGAPWEGTLHRLHDIEPIVNHMGTAAKNARVNSSFIIVAEDWFAHQAAIFEEPPAGDEAVATRLGEIPCSAG